VSSTELLREQREREQAPGKIDVAGEKDRRLARNGQVANAKDERVDRACELVATLLRVQVGGNRLDRPVVHVQLSVWISAGRNEQQRSATRAVQLGFVELQRLPREIREHGQRVTELACVDACKQICNPTILHG
jgi:hypothetical protein